MTMSVRISRLDIEIKDNFCVCLFLPFPFCFVCTDYKAFEAILSVCTKKDHMKDYYKHLLTWGAGAIYRFWIIAKFRPH